jgi:hypothetical protein
MDIDLKRRILRSQALDAIRGLIDYRADEQDIIVAAKLTMEDRRFASLDIGDLIAQIKADKKAAALKVHLALTTIDIIARAERAHRDLASVD